MANTNVLEGLKCPECGWEESFYIAATSMLLVTDDGTDGYPGGDLAWDDDSPASCGVCSWQGTVGDLGDAGRAS